MHAALIAAGHGVKDVLVPTLRGNSSALELLASDLRWEMAETLFSHLDAEGVTAANAAIAKLQKEGRAHLHADCVPSDAVCFET